jgi:tRNA G18 (ribose-2'-O)-methylase SpoU
MFSDTMNSYRHLPLYQYKTFEQFNENRPYGCQLLTIELSNESISLDNFNHPTQVAYLLGAEDNGLPKNILNNCQSIIQLPEERSLNVAVAGSIVLYDRITKLK